MSIPVATYKCTACDFSCWDAFTWGYRYYRYGEAEVRMQVARGWCGSCNDLAAIEALPTAAGEARIQQRLIALQLELDEAHSSAPRKRWWQRRARKAPEQLRLESEVNSAMKELAEYHLLRVALSARTTQARCLRCGSENCTPLPPHELEYFAIDSAPIPTGFTHPGCGGELVTVCDGTRLRLLLTEKAYDLDGCLLEETG